MGGMLTLPAHIRLVLPRLLLKAGPGTGSKIAHQPGFALYGNPPRWHKITADKPAPKGAPVAAHPEAVGKHEPAKHFTDEQWAALKLPDTNVNAPTYNKALDKLREWSEAGNVTAIVGAGYGTNTYGQKLAKIANHLLALHGSQHKVEPGQKAGTHGAVQGAAPMASADPVASAPAALQVPAFASYDEAAAWAKKRASALGMSWKQYTTTPEYHQQVYPALQAAYQGHKAEADAKSAETGKQLQAQMAELGIKPGDTVTWTQVGSFLNSETHSGVVKLDGNGVPHVHLGYEVAVSKPGGKIGYTKKLRWQPFMKPAAHAKAGGNASAPHTEASPAPASAQPADTGPKEGDTKPAADGGVLVLKNGRWVKQGGDAPADPAANTGALAADQLGKLHTIPWTKQYLPATNSNAKTHNKAVSKIENMAFAGDKAGLQAFIDAKAGAKQTYVKKQVLLAQLALAALGGDKPAPTEDAGSYEHKGIKKPIPHKEDSTGTLSSASTGWLHAYQWGIHGAGDDEVKNPIPSDAVIAELAPFVVKSPVKLYRAVYEEAEDSGKLVESWTRYEKHASDLVEANAELGKKMKVISQVFKPEQIIVDTTRLPKKFNDEHDADTQAEVVVALGSFAEHLKAVRSAAAQEALKAPAPTPAADPYPLVTAWKDAVAAGKVPTKDQAEAYEALTEHDPDAAQQYFMEAVNGLIPPDKLNDDAFDDALEEANSKAHDLHGRGLAGKHSVAADLKAIAQQMAEKKAVTIKAVEALGFGIQESPTKGLLLAGNKGGMAKTYANQTQAVAAAEKLAQAGINASVIGDHPFFVNVHGMLPVAPAPAASSKIKVDAPLLENTEPGHNKFWAISVFGKTVKTHYGKIGTLGEETVKEYPTEQAAKNAAVKLMDQKKAKGYVYKGSVKHEYDAPGGSVEQGPKDGDTKMGADGLLVFKNGRWHKAGKMLSPSALNSALAGYVVPTNTITAKAKKAALAGDVAMLQQAYQDLLAKGKPLPNTKKALEVIATAMQAPLVGAPVQQGNPTSASELAAVSAAVPSAPETVPTPAVDSWQQIGPQEGSNPGGKFRDPGGQDWYVKWPDDAEAAKSEVLAAKLYALAGLSSQDAMLVTKGGKLAIASKWVAIKKASSPAELAKAPGALEGFAVDAWLGNWDVVGLSLDNLQIGADGKAHRVDAGGSLEYRAQGAKKPFGPKVDEIDTLRDPKKNPQAAAVFGSISDADLTASVAKVAAISDAQIRAAVAEFGPGDAAAKKKLADTLIARKQDLLARFSAATKATKKALDPSALPVDPKSIPKPHDFENWNGPGKGLSSKDYVNKSNAAVEFQMQALAQAGNLTALRQFKFPAINKDTGQPTGEMLPIGMHPSKHVQQYHQDLMQVLEEVANPPEPLKVFRETEIGTLEALDAAFPPKPFGTTVKKVASNEKLGFWVALGAAKNPSKFAPKTTRHYSTKDIAAAKEKYDKASKLAKHFISSVQASGSYNDLFRDGKTHDNAGNSLQDVAKAALAHATEMPEGTTIYRWQAMSPQMVEHILSAKEGTVFQATGPMCTSYDPTATKGFGKHRVVIRYAKGAKAVESFASGAFKGEKEVTTLPNSRFVILSRKMVPDVEHDNPTGDRLELEILMLPPDLGL